MSRLSLSATPVVDRGALLARLTTREIVKRFNAKTASEGDDSIFNVHQFFPMTEETKNQSTLWNPKAPHQEGPVKNAEA